VLHEFRPRDTEAEQGREIFTELMLRIKMSLM